MSEFTTGVLGYTTSGGAAYIALTDQDLPTNPEVTGGKSGLLYEQQQSLTRLDPVGSFSAGSLAAILDLISLNGECVGSAFTVLTAGIIARKLGTCDDPLGGSPHRYHSCSAGLLRLGSLRASRDEDASISGTLDYFTTNGTAHPVAFSNVAWPSTVVEQRFRLGICKVAGVTFPEIEDVSVDFNVEITPKSVRPGTIFVKTAGVITVRPVVTLRGRDLSRVASGLIELVGTAATGVNTLLQFPRLTDGGSFASFASSVHTTMIVSGLAVPSNLQSASAGGRAINTIVLPSKSVSGAAPVVIDTTSTYTDTP